MKRTALVLTILALLGAAPSHAADHRPHGLTESGRAVAKYCRIYHSGAALSDVDRERAFFGEGYISDKIREKSPRARRLGRQLVRHHPDCPLPRVRGALRS